MDAKTIYSQIMANQENMDPYLSNQGAAPGYFKDRINEKFQGNLPAIQNAAALEARAYSLPGELMGKYDQEYGGNLGVSSANRMNSILKNIGNQFGTSNAAWNVVDQAEVRQSDLTNSMLQQYMGELGAHKDRHSILQPMWSQLHSEEEATKRLLAEIASRRRSSTPTSTWNNIPTIDTPKPNITRADNEAWNAGANKAWNAANAPEDPGSSPLQQVGGWVVDQAKDKAKDVAWNAGKGLWNLGSDYLSTLKKFGIL
jgi:hypothetical protein